MTRNQFKHFLELPAEVRSEIVNEMSEIDICTFSQISKLCNREAKSSKNYIESIKFHLISNEEIRIYDRSFERKTVSQKNDRIFTFFFEFKKEGRRKYMSYQREDESNCFRRRFGTKCTELWSIQLPRSTDIVEYAIGHFQSLLQQYQHAVKVLSITSDMQDRLSNIDFNLGIRCFRNLQEIYVRCNFNTLPFISKTRHPLKKLDVGQSRIIDFPMEKILQIRHVLKFPSLQLNRQQFLQLSALDIEIDIGQLSPQTIFDFVQFWRRGTIRRKINSCNWKIENSSFDVARLFRLFGQTTTGVLSLPHHRKPRKRVILTTPFNSIAVHFEESKKIKKL